MTITDLDDASRQDRLDSRDLITLRSELADELDLMLDEDGEDGLYTAEEIEDVREQIAEIDNLEDQIGEWTYGASLIADYAFEDYARELADEIGAVDTDAGWPTACIDWEQAARELQMDYYTVDIQGETFWVR